MHTRACLALAAALLATASPAQAASDSRYAGGCHLDAQPLNAGGQDQWTGPLYGMVFVFSATTLSDNPVSATLTCEVKVDGAVVLAWYEHGTVVVAVPAGNPLVTFVATDTSVVEVCTTVDYTSNTTPTASSCVPWP